MVPIITTLAFVQCILFATQLLVYAIQYKTNKSFRGFWWWIAGTFFMAIGIGFMPFVSIPPLTALAALANPCLVFGQICVYTAIMKFISEETYPFRFVVLYLIFLFLYYFNVFYYNSIANRTVIVTASIAGVAMITAIRMFRNQNYYISSTKNFTASVFLGFGLVQAGRCIQVLLLPAVHQYEDISFGLIIGFITPIIASTLWTYGVVVMLNQKLIVENAEKEKKMRQIFNTIPDAVFITRLEDGYITEANIGFATMLGYPLDEAIGKTTIELRLWADTNDRESVIDTLHHGGRRESKEYVFRKSDGSDFFGSYTARLLDISGVAHIVSSIHDITFQKETERVLQESEETYRSILNASPDAIAITDLTGRITLVSPTARKLLGYNLDYELLNDKNIIDFIVEEEKERARTHFRDVFANASRIDQEYHGIKRDGMIIDLEVNSEFIRDQLGNPTKMVFVIRDISERKRAERQIQNLILQLEAERNEERNNSITDALTGIANRRHFDDILDKEFHRLKRSGAVLSLIMIDVDFFKKYNDTYGHVAGDECLKRLSHLFQQFVSRAPDLVARYGGEEFVVILPETEEEGAHQVAEHIRKGVEELKIEHAKSEVSEYVTISLGVVSEIVTDLYSPSELIELADDALYRAKAGGRNRTEIAKIKEKYCNTDPNMG